MMLDPKVWVIIPAYNEEKKIRQVLEELLTITSNIVVVNDCSADETQTILNDLPVHFLTHLVNRGQGAALQTGTQFALNQGAEIIAHFDADGQMQINDISKAVQPLLNNEADISLGSRFLDNKSQVPLTKKYFILKPASLLNWFLTGLKLTDAHCGFRALTRQAAQKIEIQQDGMAHATEILDQIRLHNLNYQEVPVEIIYHEYGQKFSSGFKILRDLIFAKFFRK
ncbi:MAG: glycosyltransferase|nr:glycosyltransferase [Candidatus Buchananbacteria bacterium]